MKYFVTPFIYMSMLLCAVERSSHYIKCVADEETAKNEMEAAENRYLKKRLITNNQRVLYNFLKYEALKLSNTISLLKDEYIDCEDTETTQKTELQILIKEKNEEYIEIQKQIKEHEIRFNFLSKCLYKAKKIFDKKTSEYERKSCVLNNFYGDDAMSQ